MYIGYARYVFWFVYLYPVCRTDICLPAIGSTRSYKGGDMLLFVCVLCILCMCT